ncbi:unnamed protein product, partial [Adineta steineri]
AKGAKAAPAAKGKK